MTDQGRETRAPLGVAEVTGPSMVPTLLHGDQLLVHYGAGLRPGDVAVLRHPLQQDLLIVKRLIERREGGWWVLGDNTHAEGVDSRAFGTVPEELLLGRVRARYRPIMPGRQRSAAVLLSWLASAVRPVLADRDVSRRLRAR
ncbi:nickel-type superoxide dismutase maturation protease [Streptomyces sp. NPDC090052]|uniref:nickel-type superoxide dismutase maturation protease n=1 Tax=unclassified Streptomyces TaxID=2593676 RepID=UPI00225941E7|nr:MULTISPECIES: nickel-type superoxide dismutase maturation protease [unclassified Streptomyces]MCX4723819.1 nickel-type superoxide dismutase maturation protease [Streptomyces sp. NBC_01306]WSV06606.1 nickel-type superoxide dismutase maturation protease [Streptomyces sp. NBC_01020]WSX44726.1 nickel-type superoxide dismutase maturation protease [Streptomyces sp. NBC_00963]WSX67261.1 nickel-type superoxide dismutase maturation protease [Streptomyces sp. NBC_00932]